MIDPNRQCSTVLLVDSDAQTREFAATAISPVAQVKEIASAEQALAELDGKRPDLILAALRLPEMDGLELCRRLRAEPSRRQLPVLLMIDNSDAATLELAFQAGATDFVEMQADIETLRQRLRHMLRAGTTVRELTADRASLAAAQRIAGVGNWMYPAEDEAFVWSEEMFRIFQVDQTATVRLESWLERVHPEDVDKVRQALQEAIEGRGPHRLDYRARQRDGDARHLFQQAEITADRSGDERPCGTVQDVTERKVAEAEIRFLAYRDTLTGLPNRRLFVDRLEHALEDARQTSRRVAVLHLDIDRFQTISEGFGPDFGDQLLQHAARRLAKCLRADDTLARGANGADPTLSRLAGDEFMVVLSRLGDASEPRDIAHRLLETLARPFRIDEAELRTTGSVGVAIFPDDGECCDGLIEHAGMALAHAKAQGGNCHLFYSDRMATDATSKLDIASRLRRALTGHGLELTYQPICDTDSGLVGGVEVLLRWNDPEHGLMPPSQFIPVAEETGLALPLGELVLERACMQWRDWLAAGVGRVTMSINVSVRQFGHEDFVDQVQGIVDKYEVDPSFLRFEITEGALIGATRGAAANTHALLAMGIGLSIDDFGTGCSSLSTLRRFPADVLKVDRSFLEGVPENTENCSLVSAIIAMAHKLRLRVVTEGIESEAQLRFVRALDCESVQGHLLGEAVPAEEIEPLLRSKLEYSSGSSVVPFRSRAAG